MKTAVPKRVLAGHTKIWGGKIPASAREQLEREYQRDALKKRPGRRNPVQGAALDRAAQLAESWQGHPASRVTELVEDIRIRTDLADLGELVELVIERDRFEYTLGFKRKGVRLAAVPPAKGQKRTRQILPVGGDQSLDLRTLDIADVRDKVLLGVATSITYLARKSHLDARLVEWEHEFGEEGGIGPTVVYDNLNRRIEFVGGSYFIDLADYDGQRSAGLRD